MRYYVYILSNWNRQVLYIGVTRDLKRRLKEHKSKEKEGFTSKYNVNKLVYYISSSNVNIAIRREKQIKKWSRRKKNDLICEFNPEWRDLSDDIILL